MNEPTSTEPSIFSELSRLAEALLFPLQEDNGSLPGNHDMTLFEAGALQEVSCYLQDLLHHFSWFPSPVIP